MLLLLSSCSSGEEETTREINGKIFTGTSVAGLVCADLNKNSLCDSSEPKTYTDATGAFRLNIPESANPPILAQMFSDHGSAEISYEMVTPSVAYSTTITPFTTMVYLSSEDATEQTENLVKEMVGFPRVLPFHFDTDAIAEDAPVARISRLTVDWLKTFRTDPVRSGKISFDDLLARMPVGLRNLPQLRIATKDGADINSKTTYVSAAFELSHETFSDLPLQLNGKIRGRGNATWQYPKKPYRIQFANNANYEAIDDVAGMQKNRHWVLLADYLDRSLLRNKLALSLANSPLFSDGMKWNPSGVHVEVVLNGDYIGVYLLTENIRIDPTRLDIVEMDDKPEIGAVDGGYIVEADGRLDCYRDAKLDLSYVSPIGKTRFCVDTPDEDDITPAQLQYVKTYLDNVEHELQSRDLPTSINVRSFTDWTLLNELFKNLDAPFLSSVFLWKGADSEVRSSDRKLNLGPVWDFDISAGNFDLPPVHLPEGCWVSRQHGLYDGSNWLSILLQKPAYQALLSSRWKTMEPSIQSFISKSIDVQRVRLQAAQARNFVRWDILGQKLVSYHAWNTWEEEVTFLHDFLTKRSRWMSLIFETEGAYRLDCSY